MERYKAASVLEKFLAAGVFGPGVFQTLMSTPKMKELLVSDTLRYRLRVRRFLPIPGGYIDDFANRTMLKVQAIFHDGQVGLEFMTDDASEVEEMRIQ
jgi:hypothetical protein